MVMKLLQVFDWSKMPIGFNGIDTLNIIKPDEECHNDTYHRWYPDNIKEKVGEYCFFKTEEEQEAGKLLNEWLIENGMKWDKEVFCFHVLIKVSW